MQRRARAVKGGKEIEQARGRAGLRGQCNRPAGSAGTSPSVHQTALGAGLGLWKMAGRHDRADARADLECGRARTLRRSSPIHMAAPRPSAHRAPGARRPPSAAAPPDTRTPPATLSLGGGFRGAFGGRLGGVRMGRRAAVRASRSASRSRAGWTRPVLRARRQPAPTRLFSGAGTVRGARSSERGSHCGRATTADPFTAPRAVNSPRAR